MKIGAILQVQGSHPFVHTNAPTRYVWQISPDGRTWRDLPETAVAAESRLYRLHRLERTCQTRFARLMIHACDGKPAEGFPTLREVEFLASPKAKVSFPDWIVVVNTTHERTLPGHGQEFIPLARSVRGWEGLQAQQVWLADFDEAFVRAEPRPLCAFFSGNFKDWCEVNREWWRGVQGVLEARNLPLWASCGGAQGLGLLSEYGVDKPWDCPHCRDPLRPKSPLYTHIGHTAKKPCGDYSACEFERGAFMIRQLGQDPVFAGLGRDFAVMESHCGQLECPPAGWELIATAGPQGKTKTQCLRLRGCCVYAAQFHIEMAGTPDTSARIMGNFLDLAKSWGGYHPQRRPRVKRV